MLMIVGLQIALYSYVTRFDSAKRALDRESGLSPSEKRRRDRARKAAAPTVDPDAVTA